MHLLIIKLQILHQILMFIRQETNQSNDIQDGLQIFKILCYVFY